MELTCKQCNIVFNANTTRSKFCCKVCARKYHNQKYQISINAKSIEGIEDLPQCAICNWKSRALHSHLIQKHKISVNDYKLKYNKTEKDIYHISYLNNLRDKLISDNPAKNHGGKLSPFSKKFINYKNDEYIDNLKKQSILNRDLNNNDTTKIEYYLSRGFSEEDSSLLLKNRQTTFSLNICIEKYGKEEGLKIWKDRQIKWGKTLSNKSAEEIKDINKRKIENINGSTSKPAMELFNWLNDKINEKFYFNNAIDNKELVLFDDISNRWYRPDFMSLENKKIIEFNGDYWHGNPNKFTSDMINDISNKTYQEIWNKDQEKYDWYNFMGYKLLIIWEDDYKKNKKLMREKCLQFLLEKS